MLRSEPGDRPAVAVRRVEEAVVQAIVAVLPELVALGSHPDAAPVLGQRQLPLGVEVGQLSHEPLGRGSALHGPALWRGERAQLAAARARADVLRRLLFAHPLGWSLDPHLTAQG